MLIVNFKGGLGNQMFQYAFYLELEKHNQDVYANLSWFKNNKTDTKRPFMLNKAFNIELNEIKKNQSSNFTLPFLFRAINKILLNKINYKIINSSENLIIENPNVKEEYYLSKKEGYLDGYWQNERYFLNVKDQIINEFTFNITDTRVKSIENDIISNENPVSLHWRRGDYVGNSAHDVLRPKYFLNALNFIMEREPISRLYVFTEDFDWVERKLIEFDLDIDFKIVSRELLNIDDYNEMYLMSICKHNILSNSSFSWWGAYLNKYSNKIVLAPKIWYGEQSLELFNSSITPNSWKRIEVS